MHNPIGTEDARTSGLCHHTRKSSAQTSFRNALSKPLPVIWLNLMSNLVARYVRTDPTKTAIRRRAIHSISSIIPHLMHLCYPEALTTLNLPFSALSFDPKYSLHNAKSLQHRYETEVVIERRRTHKLSEAWIALQWWDRKVVLQYSSVKRRESVELRAHDLTIICCW